MVLNIDQVRQDIEQWIVNFVEVPHPALGGWPPCPFARSARMKQSYEVRVGLDPYFDLKNQAQCGMGNQEVIIYAYDPTQWSLEMFGMSLRSANAEFLLPADLIALEDHPADVEMVNEVCMNQGTYALALVQSLSDLNNKAKAMAARGFYHDWPEQYLQNLFQHRTDPR